MPKFKVTFIQHGIRQFVHVMAKDAEEAKRAVLQMANPEPCGGRKPADQLTDRALRYRANHPQCLPEGPKRCMWCGASNNPGATMHSARKTLQVGHIDGDETNTNPENLAWTCRSCNQLVSNAMKRAGVGRPTNQYNPAKLPVRWEVNHNAASKRWSIREFYSDGSFRMLPRTFRTEIEARASAPITSAAATYNPRRRTRGITDWREFQEALAITRGDAIGDVEKAAQHIRDTPMSRRSEFQKDAWVRRKELYGPSGRRDGGAVPF